jgi:hypothetical protein
LPARTGKIIDHFCNDFHGDNERIIEIKQRMMKNIILILAATISLVACQMSDKNGTGKALTNEERAKAMNDKSKFTTIQWLDSTNLNLGTEKEGKKIEVSYHFKNSGKYPLILNNVSASCGCTTPDWPKKAFAPGEEGVIKAIFDSKDKVGTQTKQVYVMANTLPEQQKTLSFSVEITK